MNFIDKYLCKYYLSKLVCKACGSTIPRSGKEGEEVNCFSIHIDNQREPYLIVLGIKNELLECIEWDGSKYSIQKIITLDEIKTPDIQITHYYGLSSVKYLGIYDLVIGWLFYIPYIKIHLYSCLSNLDQYFFNKKKLVTKQRIELLKFLLSKMLDGQNAFRPIDLMTELYSIKWVLHPDGDSQLEVLETYLDLLADSGDLQKNNYSYCLTGNALKAIEEYEEQERKHTENVKNQRIIAWLTFAIVLLTLIQAGLVKLPVLIDFS